MRELFVALRLNHQILKVAQMRWKKNNRMCTFLVLPASWFPVIYWLLWNIVIYLALAPSWFVELYIYIYICLCMHFVERCRVAAQHTTTVM